MSRSKWGTALERQSLTTVTPVPGTARLPPHPPRPSHVQTTQRSSMAFLALWTRTSLCLDGCVCAPPSLESVATNWLVLTSSSGITPKAGVDGPENAENPGSAAVPENANAVDDAPRSPPLQPPPEKNVLFEAPSLRPLAVSPSHISHCSEARWEKHPSQHLFTVEQIVENDHPFPS